MAGRGGEDRTGRAQVGLEELRHKILQLTDAKQTSAQKHEFLMNYFSKWSAGRHRINFNQFFAALQSLSLPLHGANDVFNALDRDGNQQVSIKEFSEAMLAGAGGGGSVTPLGGNSQQGLPPMLPGGRSGNKLGSAMRSAGTAMLGSGGGSGVGGGERGGGTPSGYGPDSGTLKYGQPQLSGRRSSGGSGNVTPSQLMPRRPPVRINSAASNRSDSSRRGAAALAARAGGGMNGGATEGPARLNLSDVIMDHFRTAIMKRCGAGGMHALGRRFRIMDDDGNRQINLEEMMSGLTEIGLHVDPKDIQLLLAAVDKNNSGSLSFDEFIVCVRGEISPRREALINQAFDVLDRSGDGVVQVDDVRMAYNTKNHPEVQSGQMGEDQALRHFLSQFDGVNRDGIVSRGEFLEYYRSVSASIDTDDYFESMIRNVWHITGGQGQQQNSSNIRLLVTLEDGAQGIVTLQDMGLDLNDPAAVRASLEAQGIPGAVSYSMAE